MHSTVRGTLVAGVVLAGCVEQGLVQKPTVGVGTTSPTTTVPEETTTPPAPPPPPPPAAPAIRIDPPSHDFGAAPIGCTTPQVFDIHNDGDADLVVDDLVFTAASAELAFDDPNVLPAVVAPGGHISVTVTYSGLDTAPDAGTIVASSNDPVQPEASAPVAGVATSSPTIDMFVQPQDAMSDILVVVDNSGSMAEEQTNLTDNFGRFIDALVAQNANYHLAVITTDTPTFRGPILNPATADVVGDFAAQALVGTLGSGDEKPIEMTYVATSLGGDAAAGGAFLRPDALLAVIIVTDEPDEFSAYTPTDLADYLIGVKGDPALVRVHTIGGDVPAPACATAAASSVPLDEFAGLTGGLFLSVCGNWGDSLDQVAASSVGRSYPLPLTYPPVIPTIRVQVNEVQVTTGWTYDPVTQEVVFDAGSTPPPGALIDVIYEPEPVCPTP